MVNWENTDSSAAIDIKKDGGFEVGTAEHAEYLEEPGQAIESKWSSLFTFTTNAHLVTLFGALLFSVIGGLVIPTMSLLLGNIFDAFTKFGAGEYSAEDVVREVTKYVYRLLLLGLFGWVTNGLFFFCWLLFGEIQADAARENLFRGLLAKDMSWYDTRKHGIAPLVSKCQTQIKELQTASSQPMGYCIQAIITAAACLGISFYHSWSLTLVIAAGLPLAIGGLSFLSRRIGRQVNRQKDHLVEVSKTVNQVITSIETVKAFNGQNYELHRFTVAVRLAARAYRSQANSAALQIGLIVFLTFTMFVQGFWFGSKLVRNGNGTTAGDVMTTFWSCLMAAQGLQLILPQLVIMEKGKIAGACLRSLVQPEKDIDPDVIEDGLRAPYVENIEFNNVSFKYPSRPEQFVLKNINLSIPCHKTTWIIGRSGSGKSTLGSLLARVYEPATGNISLGGIPLERFDIDWLRDRVTFVQQQSVLFDDTIFRNIGLGMKSYENATMQDMEEALKISLLQDMINDMPLSYETRVGQGGNNLSGGQRQRVALAQAVLRDSDCLLLDEPMSALDGKSRISIMDAIRNWRRDKTTVIITHDVTQIPDNDFVYILHNGTVLMGGTRRELDARGELAPFLHLHTDQGEIMGQVIIDDYNYEIIHPPPYSTLSTSLNIPFETMTRLNRTNNKFPGSPIELPDYHQKVQVQEPRTPIKKRGGNSTTTSLFGRIHNSIWKVDSFKQGKNYRNGTLLRILGTVWPVLSPQEKLLVFVGATAALCHAVSTPLFSYALAKLLSTFSTPDKSEESITQWSIRVLMLAVGNGFCSYTMHYLLDSIGQTWVDRLRIRALSRILEQPREWFNKEQNSVSRIMEDLEKNAEEMRNLAGKFAGYAFVASVMITTGVIWSFLGCWQLTLVGLVILPCMYGITRGFAWVSDVWEERCNEAAENTGQVLIEAVTNVQTVKILRLDRYFCNKYSTAAREAMKFGLRRSMFAGVGFGLADSAILFALAAIFYKGAYLVASGDYELDNIFMVFTLLSFSLANANALLGMIPQISNSKDTARRVLRLARLPRHSHESRGTSKSSLAGADITFHEVSFDYPSRPNAPVLRDVSFTIPAGKYTAIVGASGSGKSTLISLLSRLYTPTEGLITAGGNSIYGLDVNHLRSQIAVVPQSPVLFDTSIHENIIYGSSEKVPSRTDVEEAAKLAGIHNFIEGLPLGYDTLLGASGGASLSGGQTQRIALARALVRKPSVLVLDEATSGLDGQSAGVVRETIRGLVGGGGVTVVVVTHSEAMMMGADRVVVMREGAVAQVGGWEELKGRGGELVRLLGGGEGERREGYGRV